MTGRKRTITLFPISHLELKDRYNQFELREKLEEYLIFGSYPEVIMTKERAGKIELLEELIDSYLLKDILMLEKVKNVKVLFNLLKLLSFQVGSLVSLNELATQLKIDVKTVDRYIYLLEKSFVIVSIGGFSRNMRKEIISKKKYYFFDTGIRNAVISQFNGFSDRNDIGVLWENFIVSERIKKRCYSNINASQYFWRTYAGHEIDIIEDGSGSLNGYECKWKSKEICAPKEWREKYPDASFKVISQNNYLDFII